MNNIYAVTSYANANYAVFKGQISERFTPLQKKVVAIVLVVLAGLATLYALYSYWKTPKEALKGILIEPKEQKPIEDEIESEIDIKRADDQLADKIDLLPPQAQPEVKQDNVMPETLQKEAQELLKVTHTLLKQMFNRTDLSEEEISIIAKIYELPPFSKLEDLEQMDPIDNMGKNESFHQFIWILGIAIHLEIRNKLQKSLNTLYQTNYYIDGHFFKPINLNSNDERITRAQNMRYGFDGRKKNIEDCYDILRPEHIEKLPDPRVVDLSLEKKIAFIKQAQSICGKNGEAIKNLYMSWLPKVQLVKDAEEKVFKEFVDHLNQHHPADKAYVDRYNNDKETVAEDLQKVDNLMEVLQHVYENIEKIMRIEQHLLDYYESLDPK